MSNIISVDCGGLEVDFGVLLAALSSFAESYPDVSLRVFVDSANLNKAADVLCDQENIQLISCSKSIKLNTTQVAIFDDIESGQFEYTASAAINDCMIGNSDAYLMATDARYPMIIMSKLERKLGISKIGSPKCFCSVLVLSDGNRRLVLDSGTPSINLSSKQQPETAQALFNLAILGECFGETVLSMENVKVSFLKSDISKKCISDVALSYKSTFPNSIDNLFIAPEDVLKNSTCSVVVCDGFDGNLLLKTIQGYEDFSLSVIKSSFGDTISSRIFGFFIKDKIALAEDKIKNKSRFSVLLGFKCPVFKIPSGSSEKEIFYLLENMVEILPDFPEFMERFDNLDFATKEAMEDE